VRGKKDIILNGDKRDLRRVQLLYTVKEKGGKPDRNNTPFPMV
jgi:hypothetical protein